MSKVLTAGNFDKKARSREFGTVFHGPSRTIQSQKAEADINTIVRNFGITGKVPANIRVPTYGDFTGVDDYRSCLDAIRDAEKSFLSMPADVRKRFDNDPQLFVAFCSDQSNLEEMRKLGLAVPAPVVPDVPPG